MSVLSTLTPGVIYIKSRVAFKLSRISKYGGLFFTCHSCVHGLTEISARAHYKRREARTSQDSSSSHGRESWGRFRFKSQRASSEVTLDTSN